MKKNKLYTMRKGMPALFVDRRSNNIFDGQTPGQSNQMIQGFKPIGSNISFGGGLSPDILGGYKMTAPGTAPKVDWSNPVQRAAAVGTSAGLVNGFSDAANAINPFNSDKGFSLKDSLSSGPLGGLVNGAAGAIGGLANSAISGGLSSGAGSTITGIGSTIGGVVSNFNPIAGAAVTFASNIVGGLANRAFGSKLNEENIANVKNKSSEITKQGSLSAGAQSNEDVIGNWGNADLAFNFNKDYIGKDGWFSSKAADKFDEMQRLLGTAKRSAVHGLEMGVHNADTNQDNDVASNFIFAYGGPMDFGGGALGLMQQNRYFDTIDKRSEAIAGKGQTMQTGFTGSAKTFADGGLKAAFMDDFGKDPIAAAVRYNQGLEAMAAEKEAREAEAAREAEYADMQNRLLSLETQNQGLQALMTAQSVPTTPETTEETPESSSTPSAADYNSNWDYIEDQLKRSGKFNDVQIQGIKYNLQRESGIGKFDGGDNGTARGLAQWRGNRIPKDLSLEGQTKYLIDTLSNYDGKLHWIGEDNYNGFMNARTPEEAHYYIARGYERPHSSIIAKVKRDSDMSLKNLSAFGGELGTNGTDFTNGLLYIDEGGSHEDNPLEGVPMGLDPQGIPNLVEEGETVYNDYVFSDRMKVPFFMYKELGLGGVMKKKGKEMSFADASKKLAQESEQRPNDPISQDGLEASLARLAEVQEAERMRKQGKEYMGLEEYACGGKLGNKYDGTNPKGQKMKTKQVPAGRSSNFPVEKDAEDYIEDPYRMGPPREATQPHTTTPQNGAETQAIGYVGADAGLTNDEVRDLGLQQAGNQAAQRISEAMGRGLEDPKTYATWMRYAPAVGAGVMTLTDMLGLTNRPDYTYAGKLEAAAERAGYAPNIDYKPIGNYLTYRPMDIWYQQNALNAQSRATDRALLNSSSPSRTAGLLASGYNSQLASGNLYRQALEYNDAKRKDVAEFNRKTDMFNSQMDLEAAMANARYQQAARQMGLSGLAQAAALRDSIDARVGASRSANLTNFLTSLGNIGRENFALNQINWDRSRHYGTDASGRSSYKRKNK